MSRKTEGPIVVRPEPYYSCKDCAYLTPHVLSAKSYAPGHVLHYCRHRDVGGFERIARVTRAVRMIGDSDMTPSWCPLIPAGDIQ